VLLLQVLPRQKTSLEHFTRFSHQLVVLASSLDDARLDATGAIGDPAFGNLAEHIPTTGCEQRHGDWFRPEAFPGCKYILASSGKTDLTWQLVVQ
jgi:hypothetical protein